MDIYYARCITHYVISITLAHEMAGAQRFLYDIAFNSVRNSAVFMLWCGGVGRSGTLCTGRADVYDHVPPLHNYHLHAQLQIPTPLHMFSTNPHLTRRKQHAYAWYIPTEYRWERRARALLAYREDRSGSPENIYHSVGIQT